ncbi:MAG: hypothetical protein WA798_01280, partial [Candidatus Acidiferrum sp.]
MRAAIWVKGSMLLAGLCFAGLPAMAHPQSTSQSSSGQQASGQEQSGDSVADAARKAREQLKATPKPKKVYTDDDIAPKPAPADAAATPAKDNAAQASTDTAQGAAVGDSTKSGDDAEKAWKKRFADQREKIATAEKELDILQREENKDQVQYYSDPTKAMNEQFSRKDINEKDAKIEAKKKEIADLNQQLSD